MVHAWVYYRKLDAIREASDGGHATHGGHCEVFLKKMCEIGDDLIGGIYGKYPAVRKIHERMINRGDCGHTLFLKFNIRDLELMPKNLFDGIPKNP